MNQKSIGSKRYRTSVVVPENLGRLLELYVVYYKLNNVDQSKSNVIEKGLEHILSSDDDFIKFLGKVEEYKPLYEFVVGIKNYNKRHKDK